jgi:ABC-type branched-subunit amino acid transport system substrate-binding protein
LLVVGLVLGGCPKRFNPRADPIPSTSSDPAATEQYQKAKALLDKGAWAAAEHEFAEFIARFPYDPLTGGAELWRARAVLGQGDAARAAELITPLTSKPAGDPLGERARFVLGLALAHGGDPARALTLLEPFAGQSVEGDEAGELHAALAEAATHTGDLDRAMRAYGAYYEVARPAERRYIRDRAGELAERVEDARLGALYASQPERSLGRAVLGPRLADRLRATDAAGARRVLAESREARKRYDLALVAEVSGGAVKLAVGLALPLSGKNRLLGERALRGALVGAGALPNAAAGLELDVRDTHSSPAGAAAAVDELAAEGVLALVGSPDRQEAEAIAARAAMRGLPVLELAPSSEDAPRGTGVLKLLRPSGARAEALALRALERGVRRVVTLFPDNPYGHKMSSAFVAAVRRRGGEVVAEVPYPERTTTFISQVQRIAAAHPDALFVPAAAQQLELIAAQLYATGVTRAAGTGGRTPTLLLATADGAGARLLTAAGRYLPGALLAPVFFPTEGDPDIGGFVMAFREAYQEEPGLADALAFDALRAVRGAVEAVRGAPAEERRAALLGHLQATGGAGGVTGPLGFRAGGERAGTPLVFVVERDGVKVLR